MRKPITAMLLAVILLLTACGQSATNPDSAQQSGATDATEQTVYWKMLDTKLPDADEAMKEVNDKTLNPSDTMVFSLAGETVYRVVRMFDEQYIGFCVQKLEAPYTEWVNYPFLFAESESGVSGSVEEAVIRADGSICVLVRAYDEEGVVYQIKWTEDNGFKDVKIVHEELTSDFLSGVTAYYVDKAGNTYFAMAKGIKYFDASFSDSKDWADTGLTWQFIEDNDGKLYLCGETIEGYYRICTMEQKEPLLVIKNVVSSAFSKASFINEKSGYVCDTNKIWYFQTESNEAEEFTSYVKHGYYLDRIYGTYARDEGSQLILAKMGSGYYLLDMTEDEDRANKVEVELAITKASDFLNSAVSDFNKHSEEYYIVLREKDINEDSTEFKQRIQMEISTGSGPDLIGDYIIDMQSAAEKGYLLDLTEAFAAEKELLSENIRTFGEVDGNTYEIPYAYYMRTFVVSEDVVGDKTTWTPEEFMECVRKSGVENAGNEMQGCELFNRLIIKGSFINWKNGTCNLSCPEVVTMLEFAGEYLNNAGYEDEYGEIIRGETLILRDDIFSLHAVEHRIESLFEEKEVYIGAPIDNPLWESGNSLIAWGLSVNQASDVPEGAIAFLKYLISDKCQYKLAEYTCMDSTSFFPVTDAALEKAFENAKAHMGADKYTVGDIIDSKGFSYEQGPITDAGLDKIKEAILNAQLDPVDISEVENIIYEESAAYFSGDKTAQEVCDIIQNRVQLYLNENQ